MTADDNDKLRAGTLPETPEADAVPMVPEGGIDAMAPLAADWLGGALESLDNRHTGKVTPAPLPWPKLSAELDGGLWPGLHMLVGSAGTGKTQLALQVARAAALAERPVLYIALELGKPEVLARLTALRDGKPFSPLLRRAHDADTLANVRGRLEQAADELRPLPFRIEHMPLDGSWEYERLLVAAKQVAERHGKPPLVVLDYLQLVGGQERELRERIALASRAGRQVALQLEAPVLMLSSTARTHYAKLSGKEYGEGRNKKSFTAGKDDATELIGLGKESGDIEFNVDTLLVLCREPWVGDTPPADGTHVWVAVAKNRNGKAGGWCELRFNGAGFTAPEVRSVEL